MLRQIGHIYEYTGQIVPKKLAFMHPMSANDVCFIGDSAKTAPQGLDNAHGKMLRNRRAVVK